MILFLFSGCFSALFAVVAELAVFSFLPSGADPWHLSVGAVLGFSAFLSFALVAIIEEGLKLSVLARQSRSLPLASLRISSILFGFGFAMAEIALASLTAGKGILIPIPAMLGIILLHITTSFLYGAAVSDGKILLKSALIFGIVAHFTYDVILAFI
ncbi:MAG TPA: hypothetical protein VN420_02110 [Candidatus Fimivivens sp.]|nr:hypothetical protein [Candidatus Fimivivens sp.]